MSQTPMIAIGIATPDGSAVNWSTFVPSPSAVQSGPGTLYYDANATTRVFYSVAPNGLSFVPVTGSGGAQPNPAQVASPATVGTGSAGSSALYARQDHRHANGSGVPIPVSTATTLANDTHNSETLVCAGTPLLSLPVSLMAGFGCGIKGAFTLATGTGLLSLGAGVTDLRNTTGTAYCSLCQSAADGSAYDLVGTK